MKHVKLYEQFVNEAKTYNTKTMVKKALTDKTDRLPFVTTTLDIDRFIHKWAFNNDLSDEDFTPELRDQFEKELHSAGVTIVEPQKKGDHPTLKNLIKDLEKTWDWDVKIEADKGNSPGGFNNPLIRIKTKNGVAGKLENGDPIFDLHGDRKYPPYFKGKREQFTNWLQERGYVAMTGDNNEVIIQALAPTSNTFKNYYK